jgi:type I restriction enzyme R subunit
MEQIDQRQKTLVFCATQDHAALVRDLINQVKDGDNPNYCHRVTADDGAIGEQHLRDFQDNDKTIPTILTTSQKLSTGVDARNVRHIVLMRPINSMIEFKQIIGRGTRTYDGKDFFTIWDFVKAHQNFQDPEWDGEPEDPVEPTPRPTSEDGPDEPLDPADEDSDGGESEDPPREKIIVKLANGSERRIQYIASTSYYFDGKPISAAALMDRLFGDLSKLISDEDKLREIWSAPDNREKFLSQLSDRGYDKDRLNDIRNLVDAPDSDLFDVLSYVLFSADMQTRQNRADRVTDGGLDTDNDEMRDLLVGILRSYVENGEPELRTKKLGQFLTARFGSVGESKDKIGGLAQAKAAFEAMQRGLYSE